MTTYSYHQYWHSYGPQSSTIGLILWLAGLVVYFLPGIIASRRHHRNALIIWVLDFFFGWSGVGWVCMFVWALTDSTRGKR